MINYVANTFQQDVLDNMVEIEFVKGSEQGFKMVKETLQRMGVPSKDNKVIYQSAHILHKRGRYYICHFKEMYALDGREAELTLSDIQRRNLIVKYLVDWGMIKVITHETAEPIGEPKLLKVIKQSERDQWELKPKYSIGTKHRRYGDDAR